MKIIMVALLLSGCAGFMQPGPDLSAAQMKEMVKDKSIGVVCGEAIGPYGTYKLRSITFDQNSVKDGGLIVGDDCKSVTIDTKAPPRVPTPPKEPAK